MAEYSPRERVETLITKMSRELGATLSDAPQQQPEEPKPARKRPSPRRAPRAAATVGG